MLAPWFKDYFSLFLGIFMYVYDNDMEQTNKISNKDKIIGP